MKFNEKYRKVTSTADSPSRIVADMMEATVPVIDPALDGCDFADVGELERAVAECWAAVVNDRWLGNSETQKYVPMAKALYQRAVKVVTSPSYERMLTATAEAMWMRKYERIGLDARRAAIFSKEQDPAVYKITRSHIMEWYGWSPADVEKLRYFVCQARREKSDPVMNRALYLFSKDKMTGKTTVAKIIAGVLNGWWKWSDIEAHCGEYMSDIPNELQFGNFDRPKGCRFAAVVMDEAFCGRSTSRYYGKFKTAMTSSTCDVEVKFGGTYEVSCSRNYIFTSNSDVSSIVADESERRIMVIEMRKPKPLGYASMVTLWRDFIINCPDEADIYGWYAETLQEVTGESGIVRGDIYSAIVSERFHSYLRADENGDPYRSSATQVPFPSYFVKFCENEYSLRQCSEQIREVVTDVFGMPAEAGSGRSRRRYYRIRDLIKLLAEKGVGDGTV